MKRKKKIAFISAYMLALLLLVTACYKEDISTLYSRQYQLSAEITGLNAEILRINNEIIDLRNLYAILANKPTTTGYEYRVTAEGDTIGIDITLGSSKFFLPYGRNGKNGTDGRTPIIGISPDGYWVINGVKTTTPARGEKGDKGDPGADGRTPVISISPDGYWVIDGVKTTTPARGEKGDKGDPGADGRTPIISIGPDGYWVIDGVKTTTKAQGEKGQDGRATVVGISPDGYWMIDGVKTTVKARGEKGDKGDPGADGKTPVVTISPDGYWVVDGVETTAKAQGEKGDKGDPGTPGKDGAAGHTPAITISPDGYWVIDGVKTTVRARGEDGADGHDGADGTTPTIGISPDGYWVINGQKTDWKAVGTDGQDGKDGTNGKDGNSPTVEIVGGYWTINGVSTGVPATGPKGDKGDPGTPGKDGAAGHTPAITISPDGYWVIDGTKSTSKAVPDDGKTPLINAAKDPDNPADETYYWTIKYPGESNYTFLTVNGQKVPATGPKGDKGDQGDTPVVEPVIESVVEAPDGNSITINLHDGTSYEIPLLGIKFKLTPGTLALKDRNGLDSLIYFNREGLTIDVPYISSNNVARIEAMLPAGWSMSADISPTDSTKRIIHLTSPKLMDLDRAQFEGGATFIAFDQKGAALTQYIKLKLEKYLYMSYFYNELAAVELNRPTSPFNELKWTEDHHLLIEFFELKNRSFELRGRFKGGVDTQETLEGSLPEYPSLVFNKSDDDVEKQFKINTFLFRPDSVNKGDINGLDGPEKGVLYSNEYTASDGGVYMKPVPHDTYMIQYSYTLNNGSNNEIIRIRRASTRYRIYVYKAAEFFGIPKEDFDYKKVEILLSNQAQLLSTIYKTYNPVPYVAQSNTMTYDPENDRLTCEFCTLGASNSSYALQFYYDKVGKKIWYPGWQANDLVLPDWDVSVHVNYRGKPYPAAANELPDYVGFGNSALGLTHYGSGEVYQAETNSRFQPKTLPGLQ